MQTWAFQTVLPKNAWDGNVHKIYFIPVKDFYLYISTLEKKFPLNSVLLQPEACLVGVLWVAYVVSPSCLKSSSLFSLFAVPPRQTEGVLTAINQSLLNKIKIPNFLQYCNFLSNTLNVSLKKRHLLLRKCYSAWVIVLKKVEYYIFLTEKRRICPSHTARIKKFSMSITFFSS